MNQLSSVPRALWENTTTPHLGHLVQSALGSLAKWEEMMDWLVVSTPLKNMSSSNGMILPNIWKNKSHVQPPTSWLIWINETWHLNGTNTIFWKSGKSGTPWKKIEDSSASGVAWKCWLVMNQSIYCLVAPFNSHVGAFRGLIDPTILYYILWSTPECLMIRPCHNHLNHLTIWLFNIATENPL